MSLKRILSGTIALIMALGITAVPAFAADPVVTVNALEATDFEGNVVTELNAGDVIIVPVDVLSTDGQLSALQFDLNYDTDVLTLGVSRTANTAARAFYTSNKDRLQMSGTSIMYGGRDIIAEYDEEFDEYIYDAGLFAIVKISDGKARVTWGSDLSGGYTLTDIPEYYVLFTVNDSTKLTEINEGLNGAYATDLFVIESAGSDLTTTVYSDYDGTVSKLNACEGAFQVSLDNDALEYWVQRVYASIDGGTPIALDEYVNEDGSSIYSFPARVTTNSANAETATVVITADISTDEAGTTGNDTVTLGQKTITLNQPTAYESVVE